MRALGRAVLDDLSNEEADNSGSADLAVRAHRRERAEQLLGLGSRVVPMPADPDRLVRRCCVLGRAVVDPGYLPLAGYLNPALPAPEDERLIAPAALLLAVLIVGDPDLDRHVGPEITVLATLPRFGNESGDSNLAMGRCIADPFDWDSKDGEPSAESTERIQSALSMFRPETRSPVSQVQEAVRSAVREFLDQGHSPGRRRGRPESRDAEWDEAITARWATCRDSKACGKAEFCKDEGIEVGELDAALAAQRRRRRAVARTST